MHKGRMVIEGALFTILCILLRAPAVFGTLINRTLDDTLEDPITGRTPQYFPAVGYWNGVDCALCQLKPELNRVMYRTYREVTYIPERGPVSIRVEFQGVAVYAFLTLARFADRLATLTDCDFILDEGEPVSFHYQPNSPTPDFTYHHLAFHRDGLENKNHSLEIAVRDRREQVYLNFDYVLYTQDDQSFPSSPTGNDSSNDSISTPPVGVIVGAVLGGVAALAIGIMIFLVLFYKKRRKRTTSSTPESQQPGDPPMSSLQGHPFQFDPRLNSNPVTPQNAPIVKPDYPYPVARQSPFFASSPTETTLSSPPFGIGRTSTPSLVASLSPTHVDETSTVRTMRTIPTPGVHVKSRLPAPYLSNSRPQTSALTSKRSEIARERQEELSRRLRSVEREMQIINRNILPSERAPSVAPPRSMTMAEMQQQMRRMQDEIETLRANQGSDWAAGLTDEPPPGYSPRDRD
ncbi:hypothetical protein FA15DRAFT_495689 [Coprinopsis marcescibilis]|uniref:Uncharacterized protein n=1 Tax=Coprinopsis marcescibilis TaxID=230819 RepID=A0A5C3KRW1_COPMA|nr:hypothetical protein FA15DRAFT_495689 [Coprinopsis marcescibilis]